MVWNSDKIKSLRLRLGWSSSDLARRLNCESAIIYAYEAGKENPSGAVEAELNLLLKQADSAADEVSNQALAEAFLEETEQIQCELTSVKDRFVNN
jgi:ribosome-binding protein aMBF1 (putative translation factor)